MDLFTREIVGWHISKTHTKYLVLEAFLDVLINQEMTPPQVIHSDQGCEYTAQEYTSFVQSFGTIVSMSTKASPWENGYQESFFNNFKTDLVLDGKTGYTYKSGDIQKLLSALQNVRIKV